MKLSQATTFLLLAGACEAFAPAGPFAAQRSAVSSARSLVVDPHFLNEVPNQMKSLHDVFSTLSLSDATEAAAEVAKSENGGFAILTGPITFILESVHSLLVSAGVTSNAWGISIIAITLLIKVATFPLTKTQLESTNKMQVSNLIGPFLNLIAKMHAHQSVST